MANRSGRWLAGLKKELKLAFPALARGPIAVAVGIAIALAALVGAIATQIIINKASEQRPVQPVSVKSDSSKMAPIAIESFELEKGSPFIMGIPDLDLPNHAVIVARGRERETLTHAPTYWDNEGERYSDYLFPEDRCIRVKPSLQGRWDVKSNEWALPVFDVILRNNTDDPALIRSVSTDTVVHVVQAAPGGDLGSTAAPLKVSARITIALPGEDETEDSTVELADPIIVPGKGFARIRLGLTFVIREEQENLPVQWYGSFLFHGDRSHSVATKKFCIQFPGMENLEQQDRRTSLANHVAVG